MANRLVTLSSLLLLTWFGSQCLVGQDVYPVQGQPQGGDRRGCYYNDGQQGDEEYEESSTITRLYRDPKIIHVFTDTGLYILSTPALSEPVLGPLKPERWNPEGYNAGAP